MVQYNTKSLPVLYFRQNTIGGMYIMDKKTLVIGVIGADVHAVGIRILNFAFTDAGFNVVNLGVMVSQEEFISAAIETGADAICISSLYGQGELDCRGMREKCDEAGLKGRAIGGAQVSEKHAGFVVNRGGASFDDVLRLIEHIQNEVYRVSGIELEPEVKIIRE